MASVIFLNNQSGNYFSINSSDSAAIIIGISHIPNFSKLRLLRLPVRTIWPSSYCSDYPCPSHTYGKGDMYRFGAIFHFVIGWSTGSYGWQAFYYLLQGLVRIPVYP